jgi:hypothetical protein
MLPKRTGIFSGLVNHGATGGLDFPCLSAGPVGESPELSTQCRSSAASTYAMGICAMEQQS